MHITKLWQQSIHTPCILSPSPSCTLHTNHPLYHSTHPDHPHTLPTHSIHTLHPPTPPTHSTHTLHSPRSPTHLLSCWTFPQCFLSSPCPSVWVSQREHPSPPGHACAPPLPCRNNVSPWIVSMVIFKNSVHLAGIHNFNHNFFLIKMSLIASILISVFNPYFN